MLRILALDIGTSSVRATIYNERLRPLRPPAHVAYTWRATTDGRIELPAQRLERLVASAIDGAAGRTPVDAVATAAFWHSLVGVDQGGKAITPVLPWSDTRAAGQAAALAGELDEKQVHARTGCRLHPTYWPARLRWFREREPRTFARVRQWMSFPAYLERRWLGRTGESASQASGTGLFTADTAGWSPDLCRACAIDPSRLPPVLRTSDTAGELSRGFGARWPGLRQARWYPAIGDGALNNLGAGCTDGAGAAVMIGTSGALRLAWPTSVVPRVPFSLWRYWLDERRVVVGGALSNGGNLVAWMRDTFGVRVDRSLDTRLARLPPDGHGLTLLPFLAGERSPDYRPGARAVFAGLRLATTADEIVRAGLESVAYRFAAIFNELQSVRPVTRLVATGTALRSSPLWVQMIADVLGRPVHVPREHELTSRGAAAFALEHLASADAIPALPMARTFEPDRRAHDVYAAATARQQKLIAALDGTFI